MGALALFAACGGGGSEDAGQGGDEDAGVVAVEDGGEDAGSDAGIVTCTPRCSTGFYCEQTTLACVECRTSADCHDPSRPLCTTGFECIADPNADGGLGDGGAAPSNDGCAGAIALVFDGGYAEASGDTSQATNGNRADAGVPTCSVSARQSGRDVVFEYTLTTPQDVTLNLAPLPGSQLRPALYVRPKSACESESAADELACTYVVSSTALSTSALNQQPGTYSVWVDATGGTAGAFKLSATLSSPTAPPSNDSCNNPKPLALGAVGDSQTDLVSFANASANEYGSCGPIAGGRDVLYAVDVNAAGDLRLESANADGGFADSVLIVRSGACTPGTELACIDAHQNPLPESVLLRNASGRYHVAMKTWGVTSGPMRFTASLNAPIPGDYCPTAIPVDLSSSTSTRVSLDLRNANDDFAGYCSALAGNDLVYAVTLPAGRDLDVAARLPSDAGNVDPVLYVRGACAASTELVCSNRFEQGQGELATVHATDGGSYFVFADAYALRNGPLELAFSHYPATPRPSNDRCALDAGEVPLDTDLPGSLFGADDDLFIDQVDGGTRGCVNGAAAEMFFKVTPLSGSTLSAAVTSADPSLTPAVVILEGCGQVLSCGGAQDGGTASTSVSIVPGRSYFIAVEGQGQTRGSFSLRVSAN